MGTLVQAVNEASKTARLTSLAVCLGGNTAIQKDTINSYANADTKLQRSEQ